MARLVIDRRVVLEREAVLKERLSLVREALRRTLGVFNVEQGRGGRKHLARLNRDELIELIEEAREIGYQALTGDTFATSDTDDAGEDLADAPLATLGLSVRTLNFLEGAGYRRVADVLATSRALLLVIPNFGLRALAELEQAIRAHNLDWPADVPEPAKARSG